LMVRVWAKEKWAEFTTIVHVVGKIDIVPPQNERVYISVQVSHELIRVYIGFVTIQPSSRSRSDFPIAVSKRSAVRRATNFTLSVIIFLIVRDETPDRLDKLACVSPSRWRFTNGDRRIFGVA
jgi:hypothetical protein